MSVERAARASSWDGGEEGDCDWLLGLMLGGGAIVRGLRVAVLERDGCVAGSVALKGDTSISSCGDSRFAMLRECGRGFDVAESGEDSAPIKGIVCRRRKEFAGANGGRRAIFEAGADGLGPQLDNGEKKGDVGLLKSLANDDKSE